MVRHWAPPLDILQVCTLWDQPDNSSITLINESENRNYLITAPDGNRRILREHRHGYHNAAEIHSELTWLNALRAECDVNVPVVIPGRNGAVVQSIFDGDNSINHYLVMFEYIEGAEPTDGDNLPEFFNTLGSIAARLHLHAISWKRPSDFARKRLTTDTVLSKDALWGHWLAGPGVNSAKQATLLRLESTVRNRLLAFGMEHHSYGLIHADMRSANLLVNDKSIYVIDFDDCSFGWYLYDFASALSFIEDHPQKNEYKDQWLHGYRCHRALPIEHERELDTFVMFRRLALLGWMGTHPDVDIVKQLAPDFAEQTAVLAECYLSALG